MSWRQIGARPSFLCYSLKRNVIILMEFSSLAALKVVKMTTYGTASVKNSIKMTTSGASSVKNAIKMTAFLYPPKRS